MVKGRGQDGSALVYILIAIALLAALTVTFMQPSSQQTQSQNSFKVQSDIESQIGYLRSAVEECVLVYPKGDKNLTAAEQKNNPYPINPSASYYDTNSTTPGSAADDKMSGLRCPGNPGDNPDHQEIFGGTSGKFMPPKPPLFNDWMYYNGTDGVFFWISTSKGDAFLKSALQKLDSNFSACETDFIDATGGVINISSDATPAQCAGGTMCFRIWMIRKATAVPVCP